MQIGICATPDEIASLPELPFDYIEGNVQKVLQPAALDSIFAPHLEAVRTSRRPMPAVNVFLPPDLKVTGPSVDAARLEHHADTAFRRARQLGVEVVVFGSGGARRVPEGFSRKQGFDQYVDALRRLGPIAQFHGITIVVEPLNTTECNIVNTVDEGAEAVRRADHPHVRLLVDFFHMLRNEESPEGIGRHADLIVHAHLAEKEERRQPGCKGDDFVPFLRQLRQATGCRRLTFECKWEPAMPEAVGPAVAYVRSQLAAAGY